MNIKIKTGYGEHDFKIVSMQEAHKAYYLFLNPSARTIFSDGIGITGQNILGIEPDYHSAMGYNRSHRLDEDDWNDIRGKGIMEKIRDEMETAKNMAYGLGNNLQLLNVSFDDAKKYLKEKSQLQLE